MLTVSDSESAELFEKRFGCFPEEKTVLGERIRKGPVQGSEDGALCSGFL